MNIKTNYILDRVEIQENIAIQQELTNMFNNRLFTILEEPKRQRCLWIKFIDSDKIWHSLTSVMTIEETATNIVIKTRNEIYYIYKSK